MGIQKDIVDFAAPLAAVLLEGRLGDGVRFLESMFLARASRCLLMSILKFPVSMIDWLSYLTQISCRRSTSVLNSALQYLPRGGKYAFMTDYAPTWRIRTNMANTHQPAFVNIIWPDIEECKLVRICVCMLMRICRSLPSHFKGRTYGEGETSCHVIHTRMESVFNGRTGI